MLMGGRVSGALGGSRRRGWDVRVSQPVFLVKGLEREAGVANSWDFFLMRRILSVLLVMGMALFSTGQIWGQMDVADMWYG